MPLLIVSDQVSAEALTQPPFGLPIEGFMLTRLASLTWLGLSRFGAIILHDVPPPVWRKVQLGLHDGALERALWVVANSGLPLYALVPAICRPDPALRDLGVQTVTPRELRGLLDDLVTHGPVSLLLPPGAAGSAGGGGEVAAGRRLGESASGSGGGRSGRAEVATADEIRALARQGVRELDASRMSLTPWAREVATGLGMSVVESASPWVLIDLASARLSVLQQLGARLHDVARRGERVGFVVAAPLLVPFRRLYPDLAGRLVAPSVHWATHGAFTGELSATMLADAGASGVIVPWEPGSDRQRQAVAQAAANRLRVYLPVPLAETGGCDIMGRLPALPAGEIAAMPLADWRDRPQPWPDDRITHRLITLAAFEATGRG